MLSPPRIGSGQLNTGRSTQSDLSPGAWFVDDPSKPQIGRSPGFVPSSRIFVLERSLAVGSVPSTQMYSALMAMGFLPPRRGVCRNGLCRPRFQRAIAVPFLECERYVNALATPVGRVGDPCHHGGTMERQRDY